MFNIVCKPAKITGDAENQIVIESGKPIPTVRYSKGKAKSERWTAIHDALKMMGVGDSFMLPEFSYKVRNGNLNATYIYKHAANLCIKVAIRKDGSGYRVWRKA